MTAQLLFEDESVEEVQVVIRNAGDGLSDALRVSKKELHLGDQVSYVLTGVVTGVQFKQKDHDSPVARVHVVKTTGIAEVEADLASRILAANSENIARQKADIEGQMRIDDLEGQEAVAQLHEGNGLAPEFKEPAIDE